MRRSIVLLVSLLLLGCAAHAQKYAFVDTEYVLGKLPSYRSARDRIQQLSKQYQSEVEQGYADVERLVKDFQSEQVLMTADMRTKRQNEILAAEQKVKSLQDKYFGAEGLLVKKQTELIKPIQDQVFSAIKELARKGGYAAIFDSGMRNGILYSSPRYDKSDEVLQSMGY